MTDLQILVRNTSNPSILKMQQRLHAEVVELGKKALQWREGCEALQLALETERDAANLYAKQVAHWIGKHDAMQSALDDAVADRDKYMGLWAALSQDDGKAERAIAELEAKLAAERKRGWNECMALWADHMIRMNEALVAAAHEGWAKHAYHINKNVREALDAAPAPVLFEEVKGG